MSNTNTGRKILNFEGAGCVPRGELSNCRIRTAFTNNAGQRIYLEVLGFERDGHCWCEENSPATWKYVGYVDCAHYITDGDDDDCNEHRCSCDRDACFEYTHEALLEFVNSEFDCNFNMVRICERLDGYHVFPENRKCKEFTYGDEFEYDDETSFRKKSPKQVYGEKEACFTSASMQVPRKANT